MLHCAQPRPQTLPDLRRENQCVSPACALPLQGLSGSDVENVGYVIPTPVVNHFLTDYLANGKFTGFPALGVQWQRMESDALKQAYKMRSGQKGVLIRRVNPTSAAAQQLRADDVLMSFDGQEIASDGTVPFRTGERIAFSHLISNKFVGETARLKVLRNGEEMMLDVELSRPGTLIPPHLSNRDPSYFLVSGLVFTVVNEPYLASEYGNEWMADAPVRLLDKLYYGQPAEPGEQVVVLGQVLAGEATLGYEDVSNVQVKSFNGTPILNLKHLASLVTSCKDDFLRFDCDYHETIIVHRHQAEQGTAEVLRSHSIPAAMSADLQQVLQVTWPPQPAATVQQQVPATTAATGP
eukprot:GHUV01023896.1.p1 GENE.GHUV01023896.1~~GHUV01023896.1.p1  ORF type:complete len:352 (+),score=75.57 GHUV01023896.1:1558-2613(+)